MLPHITTVPFFAMNSLYDTFHLMKGAIRVHMTGWSSTISPRCLCAARVPACLSMGEGILECE